MEVKLLFHTPLEVMMIAARTSHDSRAKGDTQGDEVGGNDERLLSTLIKHRHMSVFEHIVYTFDIRGISRALLQELARHRHISITVESTRFTLHKILKRVVKPLELVEEYCVIPPIDNEKDLRMIKHLMMLETLHLLNALEQLQTNDYAKYTLPECFKTNLVLTVNARELDHILHLRSAPNVLWEFQKLAKHLVDAAKSVHPKLWVELAAAGGYTHLLEVEK